MVTQMFDVYFLVAAGEDSWKEILCDITAQKSNLLWFLLCYCGNPATTMLFVI